MRFHDRSASQPRNAAKIDAMPAGAKESESWRSMVLRSMPPPAWLSPDAPHSDVVLSTRVRIMRNLAGRKFPHACDRNELSEIKKEILAASRETRLNLEALSAIGDAERDYLVACRIVSPDFAWTLPGRALLLDEARSLGIMVNEEDHLRFQALGAGWSLDATEAIAGRAVSLFQERLRFAWTPDFGYLAASPFNAGEGVRQSCLLHLIGLAGNKRLPSVMRALADHGLTARGVFGESSRAIGAFLQVSVLTGKRDEFVGSIDYLIREERIARASLDRDSIRAQAERAAEFAIASRTIGLADALRSLAWIRIATQIEAPGFGADSRAVDRFLTQLEIGSSEGSANSARRRATSLRAFVESLRA